MKSLAMFLAIAIGAVAGIAANQDATATRITAQTPPTTTTETTAIPPAGPETKSQITTISGTVSAYEPGRLITILRPNATTVTYTVESSSSIPAGLEKGRKVIIRTITRPGVERPVVRKVTFSKATTKTTKVK